MSSTHFRSVWCASALACLVLITGCAATDYMLITDNDQVANGNGSGIVNTNGKAKMFWKFQVATVWPDGTEELFGMVDQRADGDRTLSTYRNFSTGDDPIFLDDLYCNPDWQGCAVFTAPDPESDDDDPFDGTLHENCSGARSVSMLFQSYRYGECGRARLPLADRLALLNMGKLAERSGVEGLLFPLDRNAVRVTLDNSAGYAQDLALSGHSSLWVDPRHQARAVLDLTDPLMQGNAYRYADFLERHGTSRTTLTLTYNGIAMSFEIAGNRFPSTPERIRQTAISRF